MEYPSVGNTLAQDCLRDLVTQQPASHRVRDLREEEPNMEAVPFPSLILEAREHGLCWMLLVTQTDPRQC